jgi:uracil-DNA glycosylase family 4
MPLTGEGRRGILIVAEAPGADEDAQNMQLVGDAGQLLRRALANVDINLDLDCWKTNALICRPPGNRTPTDKEIDHCRPNLFNEIKRLQPRQIMPLGATAVRALLGPYWREAVGSMTQWAGWQIPLQALNCWVTPNYHPSYVLRSRDDPEGPAVKVWFERILAQAVKLEGRPWDVVPDYAKEVRPVFDPSEAAQWIREKMQLGGAFAFDYETDRL